MIRVSMVVFLAGVALAGPYLSQAPAQAPTTDVATLQAQLTKMKGKIKQLRKDVTVLKGGSPGVERGVLVIPPPDVTAKLTELEAKVNQLEAGFHYFAKAPPESWKLATQAQLMEIASRLMAVEQRLAGSPSAPGLNPAGPQTAAELQQILDALRAMKADNDMRFGLIERRLGALEGPPPLKPAISESRFATPAGTASVVLINSTSQMATVYLRGVPYSIPPRGQQQINSVPAGDLTYRVVLAGYGELPVPSSCPLSPGDTKQITINP